MTSSRAVSRERGDLRLIINVLQGVVDELWRFRDSLEFAMLSFFFIVLSSIVIVLISSSNILFYDDVIEVDSCFQLLARVRSCIFDSVNGLSRWPRD